MMIPIRSWTAPGRALQRRRWRHLPTTTMILALAVASSCSIVTGSDEASNNEASNNEASNNEASNDDLDISHDPFTDSEVFAPGQGLIPSDLCSLTDPVLGAVSFEDLYQAGIPRSEEDAADTGMGGLNQSDPAGYLTSGASCTWFLDQGSLGLSMTPTRWGYDKLASEPDAAVATSNGFETINSGGRMTALIPNEGYGGWSSFALSYGLDVSRQPLEEQEHVLAALMDVFTGQARFAVPPEPEIGVPDWFVCEPEGSFGSQGQPTLGIVELFEGDHHQDPMSQSRLNGVMRCSVRGSREPADGGFYTDEWSLTVAFVFDEQRSSDADPFDWKHELPTARTKVIAGYAARVTPNPPESSESISFEFDLDEGRMRVSLHKHDGKLGTMEQILTEVATNILQPVP